MLALMGITPGVFTLAVGTAQAAVGTVMGNGILLLSKCRLAIQGYSHDYINYMNITIVTT